jgi:hypothetical protein
MDGTTASDEIERPATGRNPNCEVAQSKNQAQNAGGVREFFEEVSMIIIFLAMALPLLAVGGVFAMLANGSQRRGQSGSPGTASMARQGRAADPDD